MNTRDYKKFAPGSYYHVFNRGNGKQNIFRNEEDYWFFLSRLEENLFPSRTTPSPEDGLQGKNKKSNTPYERKVLPDESFDLLCYCLMPNHYHFLIRQNADVSIAKLISKVCTGYSKYFNKKYGRVGHLFQDKFKAVLVEDNDYLRWLSAAGEGDFALASDDFEGISTAAKALILKGARAVSTKRPAEFAPTLVEMAAAWDRGVSRLTALAP